MKRPSFQFYPGDWMSNTNLRRCTPAARGYWMDIMCLMHDSDEYGVLRWPETDIATAVGCPIEIVHELITKGVLKGSPMGGIGAALIYTPMHGRRPGDPVTLIEEQPGPIWYCSRMVIDEYNRQNRGQHGIKGKPTKDEISPMGGIGESIGVGIGDQLTGGIGESKSPPIGTPPSSSSSCINHVVTNVTMSAEADDLKSEPKIEPDFGFDRFKAEFPRKENMKKAKEIWKRKKLGRFLDDILAGIQRLKASPQWQAGYIPHPTTFLNGERWNDEVSTGPVPVRRPAIQGTAVAGNRIVQSEMRKGGTF